jgi:hypothetical protein
MPKRKASAVVLVADGAGGMRQVSDLRFEEGEWPIEHAVPSQAADTWMAHLRAETEERGWSSSAFSQLETAENSGTITVRGTDAQSSAGLNIVWERPRGGDLRLRAQPAGDPPLALEAAQQFVDAVETRQREGRKQRAARRDMLTYSGLPWRGELWLDGDVRLGPPSRFPDPLIGPQIVIVDAMCEGIGEQGVRASFQSRLKELRVFLGFVLGLDMKPVSFNSEWVYEVGPAGDITDCLLRPTGYVELAPRSGFPVVGDSQPTARRVVARPDLGPSGIWPDMLEEWAPDDVEALWAMFTGLPDTKRDQLMRAGNAYLIARQLWPEQRTAFATFLVFACETLKPAGHKHDRDKIYDVVATLLGDAESRRLRAMEPNPQGVRNRHVHRGALAAQELLPMVMYDSFADPSFDEMVQELARITRTCLVEWLRREGAP